MRLGSLLVGAALVFFLASSCGHTRKTLDAYEGQLGTGSSTNGDGGSGSGDGGDSNGSGGSNVQATCTTAEPDLPQFSCEQAASQQFDEDTMDSFCVPKDVQEEVDLVLSLMSPAEKATQMLGVPVGNRDFEDIERSPDVNVPGYGTIRGFRYRDAGRGVNLEAGQDNRPNNGKNYATAFPVPSLRAASWDLELERRIGSAIGDETAASKNNMNLGPCMNILRHPYWGRSQETYGEDMYTIGRFAAAYSVGVQEYVVACAKHWVGNNIEEGRSTQDAIMTEQTLREVYGRHFEMVVQDGAVGCIMAAYNLVNGEKATQNRHLLREILKGPVSEGGFGFDGLVITDWWAMPGYHNTNKDPANAQAIAKEAVDAGTDIEVPWQIHYSEETLTHESVNQSYVEDAARRVLTQKFLFNSARTTDPWSKKPPTARLEGDSIVPHEAHESLAEEGVVKSAVLLDNGLDQAPVLPLSEAGNIAVIGQQQDFTQSGSSLPVSCGGSDVVQQGQDQNSRGCTFDHARDVALGDRGSSRVNADPERSVGPFAGIKQYAEGMGITVTAGSTANDAADADTVVVVVGYTSGDEGEEYYIADGGDRDSLNLPDGQNELVESVLDLNKKTIIIIQSGSIVNMPWLDHSNENQATFWAGYPGMRSGPAYARLIFGEENFAGKMPMAWPTEEQLFPFKDSETETTMDYFFGYRLWDKMKHLDKQSVDLVYPFGHGMSYSTFEYSKLTVPCTSVTRDAIFEVTVDITNTDGPDGDEVAFLFIKPPPQPEGITGERPWKELKSFARVSVPAGETVTARLPVRVRDLRRWEGEADGQWVIDSGEYTILVGRDAEHAESGELMGTVTVQDD